MSLFDDDPAAPRRTSRTHVVGEDVSRLSVEEFAERIAALREEIARLEAAMAAKVAQKSAADRLFRA